MVEWLEYLTLVGKVPGLNPYLTINGEGLRQEKETSGHHLSYEPRHIIGFLHMRKQRRRSALR